MHKREEQTEAKTQGNESQEVIVSGDQQAPLSPARDRESERIVQRATRGLMKRDSRRRIRVFFRRLLVWTVAAAVVAILWYFLADNIPTDLLNEYWQDLESKIEPVISESD